MSENIDNKIVKVYWCACGNSIQTVATIDMFKKQSNIYDRKTVMEFNEAIKWGRKVEEITLAEYRQKPFMDCKCFK